MTRLTTRGLLRPAAALLALGLLVGCGSTIPLDKIGAQGSLSGDGSDGLGLGNDLGTGLGDSGSDNGGASAAPGAGDGNAGAGAGESTDDPSATPEIGGGASAGPIVAAPPTISVGFIYTTGRAAAAGALGASITSGDELAQWKLLVAEVNATGGLAGRKIKPVYAGRGSTGDAQSLDAAACATFTQDNHVEIAMSSFQTGNTYVECMAKKHIPTVLSLEALYDTAFLKRYPTQLEPSHFALDRQAIALGENLFSRGYFKATTPATPAVNGILTFDTPEFRNAANALKATLKSHGIAVKDTRLIPLDNASNTAAAAPAAQLAFASQGINRVMILDANGLVSFLFMTTAATQAYRPRYGLTSQSSGTHLADLLGGNARTQLKDSIGIGWIPVLDLNGPESGKAMTAARARCRNLMIKGGQGGGLSSPGAELVALGQCDDIFSIQASLSGVTGALSGARISDAFGRLGSKFSPAQTFKTSFSLAKHDGVSAIRDMAFASDCVCFHYTSPVRAVS